MTYLGPEGEMLRMSYLVSFVKALLWNLGHVLLWSLETVLVLHQRLQFVMSKIRQDSAFLNYKVLGNSADYFQNEK